MPSSEEPIDVNEPNEPPQAGPEAGSSEPSGPTPSESLREPEAASPVVRNSRWVDYDTYELLEMISELEDERRWARLREGVWLAILVHLALLSALTLVPKYIFKVPVVVDRSQIIDQHKDFTYLDSPALPPKVTVKPVPVKPPVIDKETLEAMNRANPPAPAPASVGPAPDDSLDEPCRAEVHEGVRIFRVRTGKIHGAGRIQRAVNEARLSATWRWASAAVMPSGVPPPKTRR